MTLMLIWGFVALLVVAVGFLFWLQFQPKAVPDYAVQVAQLEAKMLL